jgi:hypothetical protein
MSRKVKDFTNSGRELYAQCLGPGHPERRIAIDLSKLDPEMTIEDLQPKIVCSKCGQKGASTDNPRGVLLLAQTDRQMRQGRSR